MHRRRFEVAPYVTRTLLTLGVRCSEYESMWFIGGVVAIKNCTTDEKQRIARATERWLSEESVESAPKLRATRWRLLKIKPTERGRQPLARSNILMQNVASSLIGWMKTFGWISRQLTVIKVTPIRDGGHAAQTPARSLSIRSSRVRSPEHRDKLWACDGNHSIDKGDARTIDGDESTVIV